MISTDLEAEEVMSKSEPDDTKDSDDLKTSASTTSEANNDFEVASVAHNRDTPNPTRSQYGDNGLKAGSSRPVLQNESYKFSEENGSGDHTVSETYNLESSNEKSGSNSILLVLPIAESRLPVENGFVTEIIPHTPSSSAADDKIHAKNSSRDRIVFETEETYSKEMRNACDSTILEHPDKVLDTSTEEQSSLCSSNITHITAIPSNSRTASVKLNSSGAVHVSCEDELLSLDTLPSKDSDNSLNSLPHDENNGDYLNDLVPPVDDNIIEGDDNLRPTLERNCSIDSIMTNDKFETNNKDTELDNISLNSQNLVLRYEDEDDQFSLTSDVEHYDSIANEVLTETEESPSNTAVCKDKDNKADVSISSMESDLSDTVDNIIANLEDMIENDGNRNTGSIQTTVDNSDIDIGTSDFKIDANESHKNPLNSVEKAGIKTINKHLVTNTEASIAKDETQADLDVLMESVQVKGHGLTKPNMMIEIPSQELLSINYSLTSDENDLGNKTDDSDHKEAFNTDLKKECDVEIAEDDFKYDDGLLEKLVDITIKERNTLSEGTRELIKGLELQENKSEDVEPPSVCAKDLELPTTASKGLVLPTTEDLALPCYRVTVSEILTTSSKALQLPTTSSKDLELPTASSKDLELPITISKDLELPASASKDLELPSTSSKDLELPTTSSKDLELPTTLSKDRDLLTTASKDLEFSTTSSKDLELPTTSSRDLKLPTTSSRDLELPTTASKSLDLPTTSSKDLGTPSEVIKDIESFIKEVEPVERTSFLGQMERDSDSSNEVPVVSDSLGLLAESSSRVVDDDDADADTPEEEEDDDDEVDPDYDESSNHAEQSEDQSEDSNMALVETDMTNMVPSCSYTADDTTDSTEKETEKEIQDADEDSNIGNDSVSFSMEISSLMSVTETEAENEELETDGDIELNIDTESQAETLTEVADEADVLPMLITDVTSAADVTLTDDAKDAHQQSTTETPEVPTPTATVSLKPAEASATETCSILSALLTESKTEDTLSPSQKILAISKLKHVVSIVDLEESSEDEVMETTQTAGSPSSSVPTEVTSVNIPTGIEIMSSGEVISEITTNKGEIIISGVPKPPAHKLTRLNTDEITIKTGSSADSMVIPETKINDSPTAGIKAPEVFTLDSDEDDVYKDLSSKAKIEDEAQAQPASISPPEPKTKTKHQCVNRACTSGADVTYHVANHAVLSHFDSTKKRGMVCEYCFSEFVDRTQSLIEGIKQGKPLMELRMKAIRPELVEISDSESDEEQLSPPGGDSSGGSSEPIVGVHNLRSIEKELTQMMNLTWHKYDIDARLQTAEAEIKQEMDRLEKENAEIHRILDECQSATDKLRGELYATFEPRKEQVPPVAIYDTPDNTSMCEETDDVATPKQSYETRSSKRRMSSVVEQPSKRQAVPVTAPVTDSDRQTADDSATIPKPASSATLDASKADDDNQDVSVVRLCVESAPSSLPPLGPLQRAPLTSGLSVLAMRNAFGSWIRARVIEVTPKGSTPQASQFSLVRVKFESKNTKTPYKLVPARCIAYDEPASVRMTIGTRCIALFKDAANTNRRESYYSGVVAEVPNPVNNFRYLVFFDDGYAQYVHHHDTRLVAESSSLVWEEVHPFSREFVRQYLLAYPERPMVRLHTGQNIKTEWNGKWWITRVVKVDASLVQVHFNEDNRSEWIYRGSTRLAPLFLELQAAERTRSRPMPRNRQARAVNMPYVEYTRSDDQEASRADAERARLHRERLEQEIRRQRAVAKKSTAPIPAPPAQQPPASADLETVTSRVVYYTPKNAVKPYKYTAHTCSARCKRHDVLALSDLRTYNPLAKPLLSGWERQLVRLKGHKEVVYRAPCGRRLRNIHELHRYLRLTNSDMGVDLFDFSPTTHCLAEFVLNKCIVGKKDLSHGKENVPVPCVNYYDDSLPEFCSYNTERTPTAGVPLNIDPDFLCGCDCTDDCQDKSKCACWKMTLEGARTIGMDPKTVGYKYKRLLEPLPSGIYECNSRCKCKHTCLNRVAQHPLQLKLQVFKTLNRGWGIRALNDVPKGAFLCVYAGNLLTDATANLDGLNEGDEYLAELDYIEVVEQMKEGYEEDIPENDKKLDKKDSDEESSEEMSSSSDEDQLSKTEKEDNDFQPGYIPQPKRGTIFSKHLRKRDKAKKNQDDKKDGGQNKDDKDNDECITISDDEELREPSRFTAEAGLNELSPVSKYRSVRCLYGKDEACYIMDAKVQGNIGRYLNHSCSPNVFVQNVFVDTHDPRFPWVAFFALSHIKAGTELTWNYNYDIGSVPGKTLYCYCSAPNCRGRLL